MSAEMDEYGTLTRRIELLRVDDNFAVLSSTQRFPCPRRIVNWTVWDLSRTYSEASVAPGSR